MSSRLNERPGLDQGCGTFSDLEFTIADFERLSQELEQQIRIEQQISGISDVDHFAYPTFAKAAAVRRNNLLASIAELKRHLENKQREQMEAAGAAAATTSRNITVQSAAARQRRKSTGMARLSEGAI